jgi:DNA polymerase I
LLDAKQHALKIMANSLYGYLGFLPARLYLLEIANSITAFGRENIIKTKKLIEENFPVEIVYGDTDSVFVKTQIKSLEEAEKLGNEISEFVSSRLPGYLTLEFEKIFKSFLILTKKRYAGWKFERDPTSPTGWKDSIEMKGIETVRRDWCSLTSETMEKVIEIILKEGNILKAAEYVRKVIRELAEGKVPIEKLTIVKGLTKPPEEYDGVQPHVELAKKLRERDPTRAPVVGDRIEFVIIKGNQMLSKRAEDPKYVLEKGLQIDASYYIESQILPPIERIFEVCGISKAELLEGSRQQNLFSFHIKKKEEPKISPEDIKLEEFEGVFCLSCKWSYRRPPLTGLCPNCGNKLYFEAHGTFGARAVVCV